MVYNSYPNGNGLMELVNYDDLAPQDQRVQIQGTVYVLREPSEDVMIRHRATILKGMKQGADGKPMPSEGIADADVVLVAGCLFPTNPTTGEVSRVALPLAQARQLPNRVCKDLLQRINVMSGQEEEATVASLEAKIAALQEQLDKLTSGAESPLKKEPNSMMATSA